MPPRPKGARPEPLFDETTTASAPLAARLRPRTLEEFVGQRHLVGPEGALLKVTRPGYLPSFVFWGPPGSGKTTLARLIAEVSGGTWRQLSAVTSGVADVRALVAEAKALREAGGRTVLFIDELHRFNKGQQDALLPHVEDGTITLIGATTENPYYELNSPLLSRMRVYRLEPLESEDLAVIIQRGLTDAAGRPVTALPGASIFSSAVSFGLIRGGHVDITVLGGLQVDEAGHLANWTIPGKLVPGMGGAMDLVTGAKRVVVAMQHTAKGKPKIVRQCSLPLTSLRPVDLVVTELAVIAFPNGRATLVETASGVTVKDVMASTEAELEIPQHVPQMSL